MAITYTVIEDTPERTVTRESDPSIGYVGIRTDYKAGTPQFNANDLRAKAQQALAANDTFLALASPSNAQVATQVQRLTRECSALIRLTLNQLDTTAGT